MANPTSKVNLVINGVTTQLDVHDANAVDLTSNQTVGGIKTFSNAPVVGSIDLDGKSIDTDANGNMTFNGNEVDTIEEQGNGYIRYSNGLQICFIRTSLYANTTTPFTLPKSFIDVNYNSSLTIYSSSGGECSIDSLTTITKTGFIIRNYNVNNVFVDVISIGRWK